MDSSLSQINDCVGENRLDTNKERGYGTIMVKHMVIPDLPLINADTLPRISIVQDRGELTFNDSPVDLELMDDIILLGLVRQRSWWNFQGGVRVCGSLDFETGTPGPTFPWDDSNFPSPGADASDVKLPCGNCSFKDWRPDPSLPRKSRAPECREQFQVPMLIPTATGSSIGEGTVKIPYRLGFITFQKSSLKAATDYLKLFRSRGEPCYTRTTRMRLKTNLGSGYKYSVPSFAEAHEVDSRAYRALSAALAAARAMLQQPQEPTRAKSGGMLDVSIEAEQPARYSGTFFS